MKKWIFGLFCIMLSTLSQAQPTQLVMWLQGTKQLDFTSAAPAPYATTVTGAYSSNRGYNCIYEGSNPLFYIADGNVISVTGTTHNYLGTLDDNVNSRYCGTEIGIMPYPQNFESLCSKKYLIIYSMQNWFSPNTVDVKIASVDMAANGGVGQFNPTPPSPVPSILMSGSDRYNPSMAISKRNANKERFFYYQGRVGYVSTDIYGQGLQIFKISSQGAFSYLNFNWYPGNTTYPIPDGKEMELSNAGDKLAYRETGGQIVVLSISTATGLPTSVLTTISASNPVGLEFDKTGTKLFYSDNGGVNVKLLVSPFTNTNITTSYAGSVLEKSLDHPYWPTQIICGNSTQVQSIDPVTNTLNSGTTSFSGSNMPDQIDGENPEAIRFNMNGPYTNCLGHATGLSIFVHPYMNLNNLVLKVNNVAQTLPMSWYPINPGGTTGYTAQLYYSTNPSCSLTKSWTVHVLSCIGGPVRVRTDDFPPGSARLTGWSEDPTEGSASGYGDAWYVQDLDPETNAPVYTIDDPSCWNIPTTEENHFNGFDAVSNSYRGDITSLTCTTDPGVFRLDRTYLISRASWSDVQPWTLYGYLFKNGVLIDPAEEGGAPMIAGVKPVAGEKESMQVYPNPAISEMHVKTDLAAGGMIKVYDMQGNMVCEKAVGSKESISTVNLSGLAKGIYVVNLQSGNELVKKRVLVK